VGTAGTLHYRDPSSIQITSLVGERRNTGTNVCPYSHATRGNIDVGYFFRSRRKGILMFIGLSVKNLIPSLIVFLNQNPSFLIKIIHLQTFPFYICLQLSTLPSRLKPQSPAHSLFQERREHICFSTP
jgi:hypothetical protein